MALSRAGSHPVNNILTKFAAEGLEQRFLCDSGVLPEIIVPEISGTFLSDDPRGYAGAADIDIARGRMGEFSKGVTFDPWRERSTASISATKSGWISGWTKSSTSLATWV